MWYLDLLIIFKAHEYHSNNTIVHVRQMVREFLKAISCDENKVKCPHNALKLLWLESLTRFSEAARAVSAVEEANGILKDVRAASYFSPFLYASIDTWVC